MQANTKTGTMERQVADRISWAVVATVREPVDLVLAFAAHHLFLGAEAVHLFFDDPNDPAISVLSKIPNCHVTPCDDAYWEKVRRKRRPPLQSQRQMANATWVYNTMETDWLLHLDADEFLYLHEPLSDVLSILGPNHDWLKIENHERVWRTGGPKDSIFDGIFRKPMPKADDELARVYGDRARFLDRGLAGYPVGKGITRKGRPLHIHTHCPREIGRGNTYHPPFRVTYDAAILHFDGLTPLHWVAKTLRYIEQGDEALSILLHKERQAQARHLRDACPDLKSALDFHRTLFEIDAQTERALDLMDGLSRAKINPTEAIRAVLPEATPDFSVKGYDSHLGPENARRLMAKHDGQG